MRLESELVGAATRGAQAFRDVAGIEPLIAKLATRRVVMLGEASHGTHEFYLWRRLISQELISRHGFRFVAVEGDWPACQEMDDFIQDRAPGEDPRRALRGFHRWPTWMWSNTEIERLAEFMVAHRGAGFHGLDVYSLFDSMAAAVRKVSEINPFAAKRIGDLYACFDRFDRDERAYARSLFLDPAGCGDEVARALADTLKIRLDGTPRDARRVFDARQNAWVVQEAERYYRAMIHADDASWNVRDRHMMDTLERLLDHYGPGAKAIVWAHNTHIGDYRATDMLQAGLVNLGGLARERLGDDAVELVGFGTHEGSVIASHAWEGAILELPVPAAREKSWESILHQASERIGSPTFFLDFSGPELAEILSETRGHRAIGVVYDPDHERRGNYVPTSLSSRYDSFVFIDRTRALEPIDTFTDRSGMPETWPTGA